MSPCIVGLLHLLLLMATTTVLNSNSATAARQGRKRSAWIQYIDAMYAACISKEDLGINMKLTTLFQCFHAQREYLQCIPSVHLSDKFVSIPRTSSDLQTPCGFIHLSNEKEASLTTRQWTIAVYSQLHLNLTFLEFDLPMSYGKCDRHEGSEQLLIRPDLSRKDSVFLCGRHSPFSLVLRDSLALLVYRRVPSITQIGHFRMQYQVCDRTDRTPKVHTINRASELTSGVSTRLKLTKLPIYGNHGPKYFIYTVHLLGNRLKLLDIMFVLVDTRKEHFSVDAFDGPGPAELHRHPTKDQALDTKWIEFSMFQAYLQITCEKYYCGSIFIKYRWTSALPYAYPVKLSRDVSITVNNKFPSCSRDNHWYCMFSIDADTHGNVELSIQKVNFHGGSDYLGGLNKPYNCLLAGVTIADGYRSIFMSSDESYIKDLGDIPRDLAVNSVLPEITTCHDVPLAVGNRVVWGFPIDTFVSYGSTMLLVIYAYGAYVDLSKSDIKIVARPSYSAGLIVSCPFLPADGYLEIGTMQVSGRAVISHVKPVQCPTGNILYVTLSTTKQSALARDTELFTVLVFCSHPQLRTAAVGIYPHLSRSMKTQSFLVQINPYAGDMDMDCHFQVNEFTVSQRLKYDLSVKVPVILGRIPFTVMAKTLTFDLRKFGQREQLSGQYLQLQFVAFSMYISAEINASLPCPEVVRLDQSGETVKILQHHLRQTADTADCRNYMIPLWNSDQNNNNNNNNTHLIYLPKLQIMTSFDVFTKSKFKMGKLSILLFNLELGNFLFIVKIHLHKKCGQHCKYITVRIVYRALVSHNIVSLRWNLVLNSRDSEVILSDMPVSGVLLYITSENDKCLQRVCSAKIDIKHGPKLDHTMSIWNGTTSDRTPFAEYHLLWTHGDYTWDEAEKVCQELDGMHLASISSEKEYLLITRMLLGGVYHVFDTDKRFQPILTPCLMGSPLCLIYIGLKRQVS